ncbi:DUF5801 repeats-in-toxin domain-containing protein [Bradyrhizobium sp. CCBAU 51753]|uniref:DUF5801 repeats-in-toxin domain-containing protein n=1 Tax=Bradyrhizobium sp. CCBAU 51753 TaxID=1325100 RepID=UPI00188A3736|nr:DUF5801 repeats-in-toxin domain-containing protein [Bradyrhizobium sp. CCBAU 51753]QOZ25035.1 hypothetical protein XH93_16635 [Bradyrhizobium sp. CCBAU 51753]
MFVASGAELGACQAALGQQPQLIGHIQAATGSVTLRSANGIVIPVATGISLYQRDVIETTADGRIQIRLIDGTVLNLSGDTRAELSEFTRDSGGAPQSALVAISKGIFAFFGGQLAKAGALTVDTPVGSIRSRAAAGGFGMLSLTALTFALLEEARAADPDVTFLDDEPITYKHFKHGWFELVTKEAIPRHFTVEDPGQTIVLTKRESSISAIQVTNTLARMQELRAAQQETLGNYEKGMDAKGSGATPFDKLQLLQPINFNHADSLTVPDALGPLPGFLTLLYEPFKPPPKPPILNLGAAPTEVDTVIFDAFTAVHGTFSASTSNNGQLIFSLAGGTAAKMVQGQQAYDISSVGTFGTFYLNSTTGAYTFVPNNDAINALKENTTQSFTITVSDGVLSSTQVFNIPIVGANDAAHITGPTTGTVVGAVGVTDASPALLIATGTLADTDVDDPANTFTAVTSPTKSATGLGTFTITTAGVWTYTLDNAGKSVQALKVGDVVTDSFTVTTIGGTPQVVTVVVRGPLIGVAGPGPSPVLSEAHLTATALDDNVAGSAPNAALTSTTADFSAAFASAQGIEGTTISYALTITGGTGTASGLIDSHTGLADVLVLNGSTIEGRVAGGALAFTITVDPATGLVTFTEYRAVTQPLGTNPDGGEGVSLPVGLVNLVATVTDQNGNFQRASIDLGKQLTITDDGPSIAATEAVPHLTLSETHLTATALDDGIAGSAADTVLMATSGDFAAAFSSVRGADGAAISYALAIAGGDGAASGLVDSHTGLDDVLVQNGNTIEGHVGSIGGMLAFTITLDPATGLVTFVAYRAVTQPLGSDPDNGEGISLAGGIVSLTATIVDADGDFQRASLDLGSRLTITDDGPTIAATGVAPSLTLSETQLTATSGDFSAAFNSVQGADGAAISYALTIKGGNGAVSGLTDSLTGLADILVLNGNTVEGRVGNAGGALAFTIALDPATGLVTFTEYRAVKQPLGADSDIGQGSSLTSGVVNLVATIADKDGDIQSASLDLGSRLTITDDGPTIVATGPGPALSLSETHLTATAQNDNIAGSAPNAALTTISGDFSTAFSSGQDTDGATIAYALAITGGNGAASGLVDSHTGLADVLVRNGNVIEGRVGAAEGMLAFTITLDPVSGVVTFTQYRAVKQPLGTSPDDGEGKSLTSGVVSLVATITDNDGDFQRASLDLGSRLTVTDDGPAIAAIGPGPALFLSETHLTATAQNDNIAGSAPNAALMTISGSFATAFSSVQGADGATISYALTIAGGNGTPSSMIDAHTGQADVLVQNGNTIEGRVGATGGALAFTITIDPATGLVTFTDYRAVKQPLATSPDGGEGKSLTSGIVSLVATITDKDGDFQSASVDLGSRLTINDDGPTIAATGTVPSLSLSETHLTATTLDDNIAGSAPNAMLTTISGNFATAFNSVQGADAAVIAYALSITGGDGTASGLVDAHTGLADVLVRNGNSIEGHVGTAGGTLAFTITVDPATGLVTFSQSRAVKQLSGSNPDTGEGKSLTSGIVNLIATITDKDGDFQSASLDLGSRLTITDDGPSIAATGTAPSLSLSETHLTATAQNDNTPGTAPNAGQTMTSANFSTAFNSVQGADGATIGYALKISGAASGLVDSHTGLADVLVQNGNTIEGHVGTALGALAFTIAVDPVSGLVTFTEYRAVTQPSGTNPDGGEGKSLTTGVVSLVATITDKDGDFQTASLDLGSRLTITDDGPTIGGFDHTVIPAQNDQTATGNYTIKFGADGDAAMLVAIHNGAVDDTGYNLATSDLGGGITSVHVTGNGDDYTFYYSTHAANGGVELDAYFSNTGGALSDPYFTLLINPDGTYSVDLKSVEVLKEVTVSGSNFPSSGGGTPSLSSPDEQLIITGSDTAGNPINVKASSNGIAVGATELKMDPDEQLNLSFLQEQSHVSFILTQWQGNGVANVTFKVLDGSGDVHDFNIDVAKPSGGVANVVVLKTSDAALINTSAFDSTTTTYTLYVGQEFNQIKVDYNQAVTGNTSFTVNDITYDEKTTIPSTDLLFDVSAFDKDGDSAATNLRVDIVGGTHGGTLTSAATLDSTAFDFSSFQASDQSTAPESFAAIDTSMPGDTLASSSQHEAAAAILPAPISDAFVPTHTAILAPHLTHDLVV